VIRPTRLAAPPLALALCATLSVLSAAPPAWSQTPIPPPDPLSARDAHRLDRMEQVLRELRSIVFQGRETGHPVVVQNADSLQQMNDLTDRVASLEQTLTRLNGALESQGHDLSQARADLQAAQAANLAQAQRITALEQQLAAVSAPPAGTAPQVSAPEGPPANPAADAEASFSAARRLLLGGDYGAAETAFNSYIEQYADSPRGPEAHYYLGKTLLARRAWSDAGSAFIAAIRSWPQTPWAPDATLGLARALVGMQRNPDACQTLAELRRRYPAASDDVINRAATLRTQAQCTATAPSTPAPAPRTARPAARPRT
jgi:tol-pal system protein YbgF